MTDCNNDQGEPDDSLCGAGERCGSYFWTCRAHSRIGVMDKCIRSEYCGFRNAEVTREDFRGVFAFPAEFECKS